MGEGIVLAVTCLIVLRGAFKGVDVYGALLRGGKQGMTTGWKLLPGLCCMTLLMTLMEDSGLNEVLAGVLSPLLEGLHLPGEVAVIMLLRPLSGSASTAALQQVFQQFGVDSRAGLAASVLMGTSETIFYTMTVYLGAADVKKLPWVLPVSLFSYLIGAAVCGLMV